MNAIELDRLTLTVGGRRVLSDVSLAIQAGEFIGVLGANGAGKTTLIRAILGLIPPASGRLVVLGAAPGAARTGMGYMPQTRNAAVAGGLNGWEMVAAALQGHRWGLPLRGPDAMREVDRALGLVDAHGLARRPLAEMSGGERQRLLLAQALLGRPRLLLLDEPLISLDLHHQSEVVRLVRDLQRDQGLTVLFSAHEVNPLLGAIDRVLYLGRGEAALGPVETVITAPVLSRLYGTEIAVIRLNGRIFVMAGACEVERDEHRHGGHSHAGHARHA